MIKTKMKKYHLLIAGILLIMASIIFLFIVEDNFKNKSNDNSLTIVKEVIDGDTFKLYSGEIIRLICVDAPEKGEKGFEESKEFLAKLIEGREVRLEKDIDDMDSYNRSLRYVYLGDIFVNKELVKNEYARVFPYRNNTKRCDEITG